MPSMSKKLRLIIASILVAASFLLHKIIGYEMITILVMIASTLVAGLPIFKKAIMALRYRIVGIDA